MISLNYMSETLTRNYETRTAPSRETSQRIGQAIKNQAERQTPAAAPVLRTLRIKDFDREAFRKVYPKSEIEADQAFVDKTTANLKQLDDRLPEGERMIKQRAKKAAEKFERFCLYGIQSNAWLGNTRKADGTLPFTTESALATQYDDYSHRIDVFTSLLIPKPAAEPGEKPTTSRLTIGFDATTGGGRKDIIGKLTRCQNDPRAELPFGFSQIKYGAKGKTAARMELVPRYTIGVTMPEVSGLEEMANFIRTPDNKILDVKFNAAQSATTRFIMLSEMRAQNDLYQAMLPDELNTKQLLSAKRKLDKMEEILSDAMDQCGEFLVKHNLMFTRYKGLDLSYQRSPEERESLRQLVEGVLIDKSHRDFLERQRGDSATSSTERDGTYAQIMNCCHELTEAARAGKLDSQRVVGPHNKSLYAD